MPRRFDLDHGGLLVERASLEAGVVFGPAQDAPAFDPRGEPLLVVAWLAEVPGAELDDVVSEDVSRMLSTPAALLVDAGPARLGGVEAVRTFTLHKTGAGVPTASEQWRLLADGRRWTVSALSVLGDQPEWGPRLAGVAGTLRLP